MNAFDLIYVTLRILDIEFLMYIVPLLFYARSFLSAASEVAMTKPIIVIKPGRTEQAAAAAASHTGSLAGRDDVLVSSDCTISALTSLHVYRITCANYNVCQTIDRMQHSEGVVYFV